jgi:MoxR-like ATPase
MRGTPGSLFSGSVSFPSEERALARINDLLDVQHSATSITKYRPFENYLSEIIEINAEGIYTTFVSKPGNFDVRMTQSKRASGATLRVALFEQHSDFRPLKELARRLARETRPGTAVLLLRRDPDQSWKPVWGVEADGAAIQPIETLRKVFPDLERERYSPIEATGQEEFDLADSATSESASATMSSIPLMIDDRIKRMFRTAIASSKAIMLVGPPGTGKSTLVEQTMRDAAENPSKFGLTVPHKHLVVTPDESWTARDLTGGYSVNEDGHLEFAAGHVLKAVEDDRWLLLDEANRGDLDRIFGGLLTWLAGQDVVVGRGSPGTGSHIILSWTEKPRSNVAKGHNDLIYRAGSEWRLIGTYNSLDAHRVFTLGLALGRRFAQIPIPPPAPEVFSELVQQRLVELVVPGETDDETEQTINRVATVLSEIYRIHMGIPAAALGPALFLAVAEHVSAGLRIDANSKIIELIAEGYLSSFGTWLVRLDDDSFQELGTKIAVDRVLGTDQWEWICEQLKHLG